VATSASIETPSGKTTATENFPVGSWLLPASLRPYIATFYALARATDDIADNPDLSPEEKLVRLDGFDAALTGKSGDDSNYEKSTQLKQSLAEIGVTTNHSRNLISAFKQDAVKLRYRDWDDLMDYCNRSAAPVGRFLLDLHGESSDGYETSDALCNALQVINHLQDCKDDYLTLNRVYIPGNWLAESGTTVATLGDTHASRELRTVLDHCLDGVEELLVTARTLPGRLKSRRLAMESAVIYRIAVRLTRLLRRNDPVAGRVALSPFSFFLCGVEGVSSVFFNR
jgi:squalene synthase HpnC